MRGRKLFQHFTTNICGMMIQFLNGLIIEVAIMALMLPYHIWTVAVGFGILFQCLMRSVPKKFQFNVLFLLFIKCITKYR